MTPTDLMAKIREAAEKKYGEYGDAEPNINCWMAGAQFLLTELSRATEGHRPRVWVTRELPWKGSADREETSAFSMARDEYDKEYAPLTELLEAKAAHAAEVEQLIDRFETAMEENALGDKRILAERELTRKLREALEKIAIGERPWNLERYRKIAREALAETEAENGD